MKREHMTLAGIITALGLIGGLVAYTVDWGIKTQERLGVSQAERDSLFKIVAGFDRRLAVVEKKQHIKTVPTVVQPEHEGLARRLWHLFI